jgi:gamma-glutamyltranspeptidase/glutathione hydrolase
MSEELGFLYNNFVGQANPLRGHHDSIVPGKRLGGGCPTIVHRDGRPWLAIGSSGGPRLFSAVFQTLLNLIIHKMTLDEAMAAPRIHCEEAGRIYVEPALSAEVQTELQRRGYEVVRTTYMGCNQAVALAQGELMYESDVRGGGGVSAI